MRKCLVLGILGIGACTGGGATPMAGDAGVDAPPDAPATPYALAIAPTLLADGGTHAPIAITGRPNDRVVVTTTAGTVPPAPIVLSSTGHGTLDLVACAAVTAGCAGTIQLTLALASAPGDVVAHASTLLVAPAAVGDVAPCLTGGNVFHARGSDGIVNGTVTSDPADAWSATALPDHLELDVGPMADRFTGKFSLLGLPAPLAVGTYEQAQRDEYAAPGHPGLAIEHFGTCNALSGRFRIHEYTADPVTGVVSAVTVSFEQLCDTEMTVLSGCFHYATTPLVPMPPPPPDPTKVSVEIHSITGDGTPDTTAIAIFRDHGGAVVQDALVDADGRAEAALPAGGELTVIHPAGLSDIVRIYTYRDVVTGDHLVIYPPRPATGTEDQMLASFTPPPGTSNLSVATPCGGGGWSPGNVPDYVYLPFYDACRTPTFGMLSIAGTPSGNQFVWQPGMTHAPNGNVTVASTWAPMGHATVTLANIPAGLPGLATTWYTRLGTTQLQMGTASTGGPGTASVLLPYAPGAGDGAVVTVLAFVNPQQAEWWVADVGGAPSSVAIDFSTLVVPRVSAIAQSATGASWTQTAGGADIRTVMWSGKYASGQGVMWTLVERDDGATQSALPGLPAAHADLDPTIDPAAELHGVAVEYDDYDVLPGYRAVRPTADYRLHYSIASTYGFGN